MSNIVGPPLKVGVNKIIEEIKTLNDFELSLLLTTLAREKNIIILNSFTKEEMEDLLDEEIEPELWECLTHKNNKERFNNDFSEYAEEYFGEIINKWKEDQAQPTKPKEKGDPK